MKKRGNEETRKESGRVDDAREELLKALGRNLPGKGKSLCLYIGFMFSESGCARDWDPRGRGRGRGGRGGGREGELGSLQRFRAEFRARSRLCSLL